MPAGKYRWTILMMVYICMLVFAFTLQVLPPVLPLIIKEFHLSHAGAGALMSVFTFPSIFLAVLAGSLSDRWGSYKVGLVSFLMTITGTLLFLSSRTFFIAATGRFVAGAGAVTLCIVAAKTISLWFKDHELGGAMGIYNTAMPVGTIICFTTFGRLGEKLGWRFPFVLTIIICLAGLAVFFFLYKPVAGESRKKSHEKRSENGLFPSLTTIGALVWLTGLCWLWFNAAAISFSTFAPDFFVSRGKNIGYAGFLTSLLMWGSLVLSPFIGRVIDKVGRNELFIATGGVILALSLFLVARTDFFILPMAVMAVAAGLVPTPVFSYLSRILSPRSMGLGFGILNMVSGIGMFFGPYLAGFIRDKTGSYEITFLFLSGVSLLIPLTAVILRIRMKKA